MNRQALVQNTRTQRRSATSGVLLQRKCDCGTHTPGGGECEDCARKKRTLQRKADDRGQLREVPPIVHEVLSSPGYPLDLGTRAFMEPRFGHDFGHVRVHADAKATESARSIGAKAYAFGSHIVFANGAAASTTSENRRLVAHELTHVLQQSGHISREPDPNSSSGKSGSSVRRIVGLATLLESYADQADKRLASGGASADEIAPVRRNLSELRLGITQLRDLAGTSNEPACAAALLGFTPDRLLNASTALSSARTARPLAVAQLGPVAVAGFFVDHPTSPAEAEADRIAEEVMTGGTVTTPIVRHPTNVNRLLDPQAEAELARNAPVIVAAAGASLETAALTGAAIAAGGGPPGWVIGLVILAVVAVVAVGGYLYYRSRQSSEPTPKSTPPPTAAPESQPQPEPQTGPRPEPKTSPRSRDRRQKRDECLEQNPSAQWCEEPHRSREEIVAEFLLMDHHHDFGPEDIGDCYQVGGPIPAGVINDCGGAPAIRFHCRLNGTAREVSIFQCLCCDADGKTQYQWSKAHWSVNQSQRSSK